MRILIVAARRPARAGRGDQQRAWCWASQLSRDHDVTLVGLGLADDEPTASDDLPSVERVEMLAGTPKRAFAVLVGLLRGRPMQTSWTTAGIRRDELRSLEETHDVALVVTSRSILGKPNCPLVLDHVDALSLNMQRRMVIDRSRLRRIGARIEHRLLLLHERRTARWSSAQLVTTDADARALPTSPTPIVLPPHTEAPPYTADLADGPRTVDLILTGNMHYPPNRQAYEILATDVVPALLRTGEARVRVAGRHAQTLRDAPGIEVVADVPDMRAELLAAKVAIAPVQGGTGAPIKVLEAASAGCAVVAPQWVMDAFGIDLIGAETGEQVASQVRLLLTDAALRSHNIEQTAGAVSRSQPAVLAARVGLALEQAVQAG